MTGQDDGNGSGGPGSRRRLNREERLEEIRAVAQAQALSSGLQQLTHRSIAAELGVTHALVVHYEPDIESLRARTCEALLMGEFDEVVGTLNGDADPVSNLSRVIGLMSRPGREDFAGVWLDGWSLGRRDAAAARAVRALMDRWQGLVANMLSRGTGAGVFADVDPQECAWEIIALLDGLSAHTLVGYGDPQHYSARVAAPVEARLGLARGTLNATLAPVHGPH